LLHGDDLPENLVWIVVTATVVFFARLFQNAVSTMRAIFVIKGQRMKAAWYSFIETLTWLVIFSVVIRGFFDAPSGVGTVANFIAFAAGFAAGSYAGILIEERMAVGHVTVQVISIDRSKEVGRILRDEGFPVTMIKARGTKGPRTVYQSVIPRRRLARFLASVDRVDSDIFTTIMDTRSVMKGKTKMGG
jgi:uncharacterized protein YebE (UPF0316 family)